MLLHVDSVINGLAPEDLTELMNQHHPNWQLRSASLYLLSVLVLHTKVAPGSLYYIEMLTRGHFFYSSMPTEL